MIDLIALALQAAAPDVVSDIVTATSFQTTPETQPMIVYYQNCLAPPGVMIRPPVSGTVEAQANARIAACAHTRAWAQSTGSAVYKPKSGGDPIGERYMKTSLDQVEQGFLAQARFMDNLISGKIKPSDLKRGPVVLTPNEIAK